MKPNYKMYCKRLENSPENIFRLETLRFQAYNMKDAFEGYTLYAIGIHEGSMVPFGFYINNQLAAGCYVSCNFGSLHIEQLFVHPSLQESGLRAGRLLLNYVLINKKELEDYFHTTFEYCTLEPSSEKAKAIYEKVGFKPGEMYMKKPIK